MVYLAKEILSGVKLLSYHKKLKIPKLIEYWKKGFVKFIEWSKDKNKRQMTPHL
jgi:hypothetical protein